MVDRDARRLALLVEYDGTQYRGFQLQPNGPTIQGELETAIEKVTGEASRVAGASRTDSGVHAEGQVVSFTTGFRLSAETFVEALNYYLASDIAVQKALAVPSEFDVRRRAASREYRYSILNRRPPSPLRGRFHHQVGDPLDVDAMNTAARLLIGVRDFASFTAPQRSEEGSTVRQVIEAGVTKEGELVLLDIEANAYLYQQIRRTAGTLVSVGLEKSSIDQFEELLKTPSPGTAGPTLPAKGLRLKRVNYPDTIAVKPGATRAIVSRT
jgi:tRNA pseudouridine38-40 synthase